MHRRKTRSIPRERGAIAILVALSLIMLFGFASLAIDMGRFRLVNSELQTASDSGALAGAWQLDASNSGETQAHAKGSEFAEKHWADFAPLEDVDPDQDVLTGHWDFASGVFTEGGALDKMNAVQVTTYRGSEKGTAMVPWLGAGLGFGSGDAYGTAVAVGLGPGCGNAFPVAVPECVVKDSSTGALKCDGSTELQLSNDIIDSAGITSLSDDASANVNTILDLIKNYDPTAPCNSTVDDNIKVQNGDPRQPVGTEIRNSILDPDGDGVETPVVVCMAIIDAGVPCSQIKFNQTHQVSGYVAFRLEHVILPGPGGAPGAPGGAPPPPGGSGGGTGGGTGGGSGGGTGGGTGGVTGGGTGGGGGSQVFLKGSCLTDSDACGGPAGGGWYGVKGKPRLVQ